VLLLAALGAWPARAEQVDPGDARRAAGPADAGARAVAASGDLEPSPLALAPPLAGEEMRPMLARPRRSYGVPAVESLALQAVMMAWNRWVGDASWSGVTPDSIGRNVRGGWSLDTDRFWVNQFGHPYSGTWSFTAARSAGLGFWASAPYAFAASALWEYAGETERPAINDQITTPVAGAVLGEILWRLSGLVLAGGDGSGHAALASLLSPMGAVNGSLLGTRPPRPGPSELVAWAGALSFTPSEHERIGAGETAPELGLHVVYGPPGDPRTEFEHPFDHFDLVAAYAARPDPIATLHARGLLAALPYEGERTRGLWGLYLSFDLATPRQYRISSSALGVGTSGRYAVTPGIAVDATAVASGIFLGAAGVVPAAPDGAGRDYRFGPGAQAVFEAQVLAGDRATVGCSVRHWILLGAGEARGTEEHVAHLGASGLVRLWGRHALGVEATFTSHTTAEAGGPGVEEHGRIIRAYYALVGSGWTTSVGPPHHEVERAVATR
jgi:uncharacterized protein DUF3943